MIWIDSRPIRNRALKKYQKVRRQLQQAREQIHHFEQMDRPAFQKWLFQRFGPLLTDLRETQRALHEKLSLMELVEETALRQRISHARAYQQVMERIRNPGSNDDSTDEKDPAEAADQDPPDSEEKWDREEDVAFGEAYDQFKQAFEENFGVDLDDLEEKMGFNPFRLPGLGRPKTGPNNARLKQCYRALARRLHPDANPNLSDEQKRMWHQAQEALGRGDLEMMEALLVMCEMDETDPGATTPVSLIDRLTRHFSHTLRQMQSSIFRHRRDSAWNFSARTDHGGLARQLKLDLRNQLVALQAQLSDIENRLATWERSQNQDVQRPAQKRGHGETRRKQGKARKRQFDQDFFEFERAPR